MSFLIKFDWGVKVFVFFDVCRRVVFENIEDVVRYGLYYVELRFLLGYMVMVY